MKQIRFRCTGGFYHKQFKTARTRAGESQQSSVDRIKMYLKNWIEMSGLTNDYEGLHELIVRDSYFQAQLKEVQTYLKEAGKLPLAEMSKHTQHYKDAYDMHGNEEMLKRKNRDDKTTQLNKPITKGVERTHKFENRNSSEKRNVMKSRTGQVSVQQRGGECWVCGSLGHRAFCCPQKATASHHKVKTSQDSRSWS